MERTKNAALVAVVSAGLLALIPALSRADAEAEARYPFDPACAWGRVANGKGMLVRCVTEAEARRLAGTDPSAEPAKGSLPDKSASKADEAGADEPTSRVEYSIDLLPIQADEGTIAHGKLTKPMDRYRECIDDAGGLSKPQAKVVVEFLVRAERRRAEGAEVRSYAGVSKKAADCIASVIDRREVGTPSVPLTGATLTLEIKKK